MTETASAPIPMFEQRRIEAMVLHVYDTLKASHGVEVAQKTMADAVRSSSIEQAKEFAAKVGGRTSIQTFGDRQLLWKLGGAMEIEVEEQTETRYVFNVTRCKYAEMYRDMGLGEIGHLLSCQRDATLCEGYDKRMRLKRTQTIMQGAGHCDFQYTMVDEPKASCSEIERATPDLRCVRCDHRHRQCPAPRSAAPFKAV